MAAQIKETFKNGTPFIGLRGRISEFKFRTERHRKWSPPYVGVQFLLLALVSCCHGYQEQRFAMEPQDQVSFTVDFYFMFSKHRFQFLEGICLC